ncbi:MAG: response regulator consisting of a CheY-like receiver domain and a Fis-type domain protein [Phycisphaerales bacterium]|nr:response regulator consisting of a CheY-like receiver domain and a Fis-type domain protein [Phycisphaerales bacterium]MDB5354125.1 response regulator consisting of a CheY-like receiver domain and a Fis-type domain protein [Phycisphaerales bacterium]
MDTATKNCALIVEDDADTREWLDRVLRGHSYEATSAATLAEAFQKLEDGPCCVILDLALPDGNGVEILRRIRNRQLPVKVAVLTGSTDFSTVGTAILLKPDALFTKPVDANELLAWLSTVCF